MANPSPNQDVIQAINQYDAEKQKVLADAKQTARHLKQKGAEKLEARAHAQETQTVEQKVDGI